ncbi:MAG: LysE/ArgO family amino acid transporter [Alphaproteobacteria bacterium]|nr:LysE/ArgO family amino acid transporter [Alphaproteobacteria bacterium]
MENFCVAPFLEGCGSSAGLIIAIGAQNAFVLKQGILKNHVFVTAFICAAIDALLIALGVGGFSKLLSTNAYLLEFVRWGGIIFLVFYGFRLFRSAFSAYTIVMNGNQNRLNLKMTILTALALSLLNPEVYLDTVVLLGSIGAQFPETERFFFAMGAMSISFIWFFGLCYGSRYLAPLFQKPLSWKILDFIIGCVMWLIALFLLFWDQTPNCNL